MVQFPTTGWPLARPPRPSTNLPLTSLWLVRALSPTGLTAYCKWDRSIKILISLFEKNPEPSMLLKIAYSA